MTEPTDREITLARGLLALLRTHEQAGDPSTWTIDPADWGDGRISLEVHRHDADGWRGLVCQFRPNDIDGTPEMARACVDAVQAGVAMAREIVDAAARPRFDATQKDISPWHVCLSGGRLAIAGPREQVPAMARPGRSCLTLMEVQR